MPAVSFIVPIYNSELFLQECLESIQAQSITDIEIICIDDASSDFSRNIIKSFSSRDSRFKLISLVKNKGVGYARNTGLKRAQGKYIRMVDADDFIPPDSTKKLLDAAIQHKSELVRGGYWSCSYDGKWLRKGGRYPLTALVNGKFSKDRELWFFDQHTTYLYSAAAIKNTGATYSEDMRNGQDVAFLVQIIPNAINITLIPETVYCYRSNQKSTTRANRNKIYYLNLFSLYELEYKKLGSAGYTEQVDSFMFYHLGKILPKNVLPRITIDLPRHEAIDVLSELNRVFSKYGTEDLCFGSRYDWQSELKIPLLSRQIIILLSNERYNEAYETLKKHVENTNKIKYYKNCFHLLKKSTSWKITAPLRKLLDLIKSVNLKKLS